MSTNVGSRCKALRKFRGETQQDLADRIGKTYQTISNLEKTGTASEEVIAALKHEFGEYGTWFITGEGSAPNGVVLMEDINWRVEAFNTLKATVESQREEIAFLRALLLAQNKATPMVAAKNFSEPLTSSVGKQMQLPLFSIVRGYGDEIGLKVA